YLQQLSNIDVLADIQYNISSNIGKYNYLITKKNQLDKLSQDKKYNLTVINSFKELSKVEKKANEIINLYNLNNQLIKYKDSLKRIGEEATAYSLIKEKLKEINYVENNLDTMLNAIERLKKLNDIKVKKDALGKSLAIGERYIEKFENLDE